MPQPHLGVGGRHESLRRGAEALSCAGSMRPVALKPVVVETYTSRRQLRRGIERMAARGYELKERSGELSGNPLVFWRSRPRVVATFQPCSERDGGPAAAPGGALPRRLRRVEAEAGESGRLPVELSGEG